MAPRAKPQGDARGRQKASCVGSIGFLAGRELEKINRTLIDTITEARRAEGCANGTVNRTLALLRAILRRCVREWEWMDRAPAIRLLKEPSRRIRFLTHDQAMLVLRELPLHLRAMAAFTLCDRASPGERHRTHLGAGGSRAQARVGASRSSQGPQGHWRPLERDGAGDRARSSGEASGASLHVRRETCVSGEFQGVVQGTEARGDRGLPLARLATHLGLMACAERNALVCTSRNGGLGDRENGAALCAPSRGASRRLRRQLETSWHNPGTVAGAAKTARTVTLRKIKDFLVAREGIEPPTRGFSVRCSTN